MVAMLTSASGQTGQGHTHTNLLDCNGCNGSKKCNCQCLNYCEECGMAKCRAQRETKWRDGTLNTEHRREFTEKNVPREGRGKAPFVDSLGKFYGTTTNKADFTPKKAHLENPNKGAGIGPALPFTGQSTYNMFHNGKQGAKSDPYRKVDPQFSGKFYGQTTNKVDYNGEHVEPREGFKPGYSIVNLPFDATSTYKDDFNKKQAAERARRAKAELLPSINTENYTTYGVDYVPLPFSKPKNGDCCADVRHTATRRDPATL